jgi:protein arginine kinase
LKAQVINAEVYKMAQSDINQVPQEGVSISSRIRLARNLDSYPFIPRMSAQQGGEIIDKVGAALANCNDEKVRELLFVDMNSIKPLDKQVLVEKHLISPEFAEGEKARAAVISKDEHICIMVNEEDHLRLQCIFPGMQFDAAWDLCNRLDDILGERLNYAFDKTSGYLTCCPTNAGTGLRASVMMHLPALSMTGYIKGILETCAKIGVAVRGIYGENSEASGYMYQVSNQVTLGQSEEEIIAGISNITAQIADKEKMLRSELYKQIPSQLEDRVFRAFGLLTNARIMSTEECLKLLSDVRLGVIMGLLTGLELRDLNKLTIMIQPAHIQKLSGIQLAPEDRDLKRAEFVRRMMKEYIH